MPERTHIVSPCGAPSTAPKGSWDLRALCGICVDWAVASGRTDVAVLMGDADRATCPACLLVHRIMGSVPALSGEVVTVTDAEIDILVASVLGWAHTQHYIQQLNDTGRCELYGRTIQRIPAREQ